MSKKINKIFRVLLVRDKIIKFRAWTTRVSREYLRCSTNNKNYKKK